MKAALGIFYFNAHWNLNVRSAHRHCTEALAPLLRSIVAHPSWSMTIAISGSGLEFINDNYPGQLRLLRNLVHRGQVELISSFYTPTAWIAFPLRDVIESVERNTRCLSNLGFPMSRTFLAHEMFFGAGVTALQEYFDVAICRDDYLSYYYDLEFSATPFSVAGMKILVASNHILNELSNWIRADPAVTSQYHLTHTHSRYLKRSRTLNDAKHFPAASGRIAGTEWLWYHCGDGNHFGGIYKPDNLFDCYYDPIWSSFFEARLSAYEKAGYSLETVGTFVEALDYSNVVELPPLIEGCGNPSESGGVFCWMGKNSTPWEDDASVLSAVARARSRVIAAERLHARSQNQDRDTASLLAQAWDSLLRAEIGDSLGWFAGADAVQHALCAADEALCLANRVLDEEPPTDVMTELSAAQQCIVLEGAGTAVSWPVPVIFGATGDGSYSSCSPCVSTYDCELTPSGPVCGLRFPFEIDELVFCPSGLEDRPSRVPCCLLKPEVISLPLANGLIQIGDNLFLIKDIRYIHVAAAVRRRDSVVEFSVHGARQGRPPFRWRFYLIRSNLESAVAFANATNGVRGCR